MADNVTRNRAGQIVRDTSVLPGALRGLADMLTGAGRGSVAMTLGAPADILNLLRVKQLSGSDIPYGSEYFLKNLPLAPTTQTGRVSQELGGFVPTPAAAVTTPAKTLAQVAKASAPYAARSAVGLAEKYGVAPTMNIIKPKGGNWLAGSVEEAIRPLRTRVIGQEPANRLRDIESSLAQNIQAGVPVDTAFVEQQRAALAPDIAINKWLDTKLAKYIRNEMGTLEDPLRELAGRGITHVPNKEDLMMSGDWIPEETARNRRFAGYPEDATTTMIHAERGYPADEEELARLAAGWENAADSAISLAKAKTISKSGLAEDNKWIANVDPETMVYQADRDLGRYGELGFPHLVDELKNAMDPASGLPRHLQLDPKKLDKITVPQASELVAKINAWRAEQKIAADAEKANNAATVLHKEYPEQGYKWVELRQPEGAPKAGYGVTPADDPLTQALKYEGDVMGHCVGGYCPDVAEGRSRIFSLRDKKGEPHVTIEVQPYAKHDSDFVFYELQDELGRPPTQQELDAAMAAKPPKIIQIKGKANRKPKDEYLPFVQDFVRSGKWSDVGDIQNADLYKIDKDFLGDLSNFTPSAEDLRGLGRHERMQLLSDAIDKGYLPEKGFVSRDEWEEGLRKMMNESKPNFATGGLVDDIAPDQMGVNRMVELQEGGVPAYAGGGLVGLESKYGLAPYGLRHAGDSAKGLGYFGAIPGREGHMTEVSAEDDLGEYPLLVPGLTGEEIRHLAEGNEPTEEIYRKVAAHADRRRAAGRSTFIEQGELRHPKPEFAGGGLVRKALKELAEKFAIKEESNLARKGLLNLKETDSKNLPAVIQNPEVKTPANPLGEISKQVLDTPLTRRQVLKSMLSQSARTLMPGELAGPLARLASENIAKTVVDPSTILNPELKAAVYNLPRSSLDWNWRKELLDRGYIAKNVLRYAGEPLVGEGKIPLKEALRQMKSEPEVYEKFKGTLHALGNEERNAIGATSKQEYLDTLASYGYPKNIIARESRIWDQSKGKFKRTKLPGEESQHPMYDPQHASFNPEFEELIDIAPEFQEKLKGLTTKEAKKIWSDYAKSEEGKLTIDILKNYRKNENAYWDAIAEARGVKPLNAWDKLYPDWSRNLDLPVIPPHIAEDPETAVKLLTRLNKRLPSLEEVNSYLKSAGSNLTVSPENLNTARSEILNAVRNSRYYPKDSTLYESLGLDVPVYQPPGVTLEDITKSIDKGSLSKVKPSGEAPEEFARGGFVEYNPAEIENAVARLREDMYA